MPPFRAQMRGPSKSLESFYGSSNPNPAKTWDNVYCKNVRNRKMGRMSHQAPARRPGFGGGRPGDSAFNQILREKEQKYLEYLELYTLAELRFEEEEVVPSKEDADAMKALLAASGFKSTRSSIIFMPPKKRKRREDHAAIPVRYSKRLASLARKKV
mmetsp:Transcript_14400/g.28669  ORF Transcript_14400/g.28669 Transcript_14400/m.28669 type:complete len:157 (-) Transcript_14400:34-504(-)